jgi:hypothetical protein
MQTGDVVANLSVLNEHFRLPEVDALVERKRAGAEKMRLDPAEIAEHETHFDRLERALQDAAAKSALPGEPTSAAALDDFVVRLRLDELRRA